MIRSDVAVVRLRAARPGPDRPRHAGLRRPPRRRRRAGRDQGDHDRRQHALLGILGAPPQLLAGCSAVAAERSRARGRRGEPADYAAFVAYPGRALRHPAGGDRGLERARPGQRSIFRGPRQTGTLRGAAARRLPGDQGREPQRAGARRLARGLERRVPARALRGRHQGLLRRPRGPLLHADARLACARSTKSSSPTATTRRCGSTSSAGAAAGRGEDRAGTGLRDRGRRRRANITNTLRSLARTPVRRGRGRATSCSDSPAKNSACSSASGARKPSFAALRQPLLANPFGRDQPR